jgi:hypothetical protein
MKKAWMILALVAVCALISTASAIHFTSCDNGNRIVVTYVNSSASYDDVFGIVNPVTHADMDLGMIHTAAFGTKYYPLNSYAPTTQLEVFITAPGGHTYRVWKDAGDGVPDPFHTKALEQPDGSWTIGFEDLWGGGDKDYNDVFLNVACEAGQTTPTPDPTITPDPTTTPDQRQGSDPIATPEFPTVALPAAMIIGLLGIVLFMKRTE